MTTNKQTKKKPIIDLFHKSMIGNKQTNKKMGKNSQTQTVAILSSKKKTPGKIIDSLCEYIIGYEQTNKQQKKRQTPIIDSLCEYIKGKKRTKSDS